MVKVIVSDHAVLRYAERQYGLPVDKLRTEIEEKAYFAAKAGAARFQIGNISLALRADNYNEHVFTVATVLDRSRKPYAKPSKKNRRREIEL